ncbi:MAG TPA: transglutaminase-like domain-containing protein [Smithellaceae bacterium]|nr:transglutaminase-like domain-containing protein [Smithellaceae bacterium]
MNLFNFSPIKKPNLPLIWGVSVSVLFLILLVIRLDLFVRTKEAGTITSQHIKAQRPAESWMNIYQDGKKIGFVQRQFLILESGNYETQEKVTMQIKTLGTTQLLHLAMETVLNPDMSFSSFSFDLSSSLFRFSARGYVSHDKLILHTGIPAAMQKSEIRLKDIPYISGNIYEAALTAGLETDGSREFTIFDPSTAGVRKIKVTREKDEVIPIMGRRVMTQKLCADFMGAKNCAWLSKEGEILKETGLLGLSMEKVNAQTATAGFAADTTADFAQIASLPSNVIIAAPDKLKEISIRIDGVRDLFLILQGGRQLFQRGVLTVRKENISAAAQRTTDLPENAAHYLRPSPLVQSDHARIKEQALKIVGASENPLEKTRKIVNWVYRNIEKKPVLSVPNALEVLKNKTGDCNEHAVLAAALLRAAGVPAQIETGLVYQNGRFYYHAWNSAYAGKWITADAVFNQIPADVTHLRLARGEGSAQLDLLGAIGKIKLEVISVKND